MALGVKIQNPATPPVNPPPLAPVSLSAIGVVDAIDLQWSSVSSATGFNIYSGTDGVDYTIVANPTGTTYSDSSAVPGQLTYYRVTSVGSGGESTGWALASATALATPPVLNAPTGLTATFSAGSPDSVALSWSSVSGATGYAVNRASGSGPGISFTQIATPSGTSYTDSSLPASSALSYEVVATNGSTTSPPSNVVTVNEPAPPPQPPTGLQVTSSSAGILLQWTSDPNATSVSITRSTDGGATYPSLVTGVTTTQYDDTSAAAGTPCLYRLYSVGPGGTSATYATASGEVPVPAAPAPPSNLHAVATPAQVTLSWTPPSDPSLAEFGIYEGADASTGTELLVQPANGIGGSVTAIAWAAGVVTVTVANTVVVGQLVVISGAVPVALNGSFIVATASATQFTYALAGSGVVTAFGFASTPPAYLYSPVTQGQTYFFAVTSIGLNTLESAKTIQSCTVPTIAAATAFQSTGTTSSTIILAWVASATAGVTYTISRSTTNGSGYTAVATGLAATTYTDTGLASAQQYFYRIFAELDGVYSTYVTATATCNTTNPTVPPAAPTGLGTTGSTSGILLAWTASAGPNLANYTLWSSTTNGSGYTQIAAPGTLSPVSAIAPSGAGPYTVTVTVDNNFVAGQTVLVAGAASSGTAVNGPQTIVTASATGLTFSVSANPGTFSAVASTVITATSYFDSSTKPGTTEYYRLFAIDIYGNVSAAATTSGVRTVAAPTAPSFTKVTPSSQSIALTWSTPAGTSTFNLYQSPDGIVSYVLLASGLTVASYTDTNVGSGATRYYEVTAVNAGGESPDSSPVHSTRSMPAVPGTPSNFAASVSGTTVSLSWSPVAVVPAVTSYTLQRSPGNSPYAWTTIANPSGSPAPTSFFDTTAPTSATSYYRVLASNANGSSAYSAVVSVAVPATTSPSLAVWNLPQGVTINGIPGWTTPTYTNPCYVSTSAGSDSNNGSKAHPFATAAHAGTQISHGNFDAMLLRCGDLFASILPGLSGPSAAAPLWYSAYEQNPGDGAALGPPLIRPMLAQVVSLLPNGVFFAGDVAQMIACNLDGSTNATISYTVPSNLTGVAALASAMVSTWNGYGPAAALATASLGNSGTSVILTRPQAPTLAGPIFGGILHSQHIVSGPVTAIAASGSGPYTITATAANNVAVGQIVQMGGVGGIDARQAVTSISPTQFQFTSSVNPIPSDLTMITSALQNGVYVVTVTMTNTLVAGQQVFIGGMIQTGTPINGRQTVTGSTGTTFTFNVGANPGTFSSYGTISINGPAATVTGATVTPHGSPASSWTIVCAASNTIAAGETVNLAGMTNSGTSVNGPQSVTAATASTFTFVVTSDPGTFSAYGTATIVGSATAYAAVGSIGNSQTIPCVWGVGQNNCVFWGLDFSACRPGPAETWSGNLNDSCSGFYAASSSSPSSYFLFEGCRFSQFQKGIIYEAGEGAPIRFANLVVRRSVFLDMWSGVACGSYFSGTDNSAWESCFSDYNGWIPSQTKNNQFVKNHFIYSHADNNGNITVTDCTVGHSAGDAIQLRSGGVGSRLAFLNCPGGITPGFVLGNILFPGVGTVLGTTIHIDHIAYIGGADYYTTPVVAPGGLAMQIGNIHAGTIDAVVACFSYDGWKQYPFQLQPCGGNNPSGGPDDTADAGIGNLAITRTGSYDTGNIPTGGMQIGNFAPTPAPGHPYSRFTANTAINCNFPRNLINSGSVNGITIGTNNGQPAGNWTATVAEPDIASIIAAGRGLNPWNWSFTPLGTAVSALVLTPLNLDT